MYKHLLLIGVVAVVFLTAVSQSVAMDPPCTQCGDQCICDKPPPLPAIHPCWYFRSDALVLRRDVRHTVPVAAIDGNIVLSAGDLDQPFQAGGEFLIGHTFGDTPFSVEFSYFALAEWDESGAVRDASGELDSPFTNFGSNPLGAAFDSKYLVDIHETSQLQNGELNLMCVLPTPPSGLTSSFIFGLRYMRVGELFGYSSGGVAAPVNISVATQTRNELLGPQIGGLFEFYAGNRYWVNFAIKGAICNNSARQTTAVSFDCVYQGQSPLQRGGSGTSYVADFALTAIWRMTPHLTSRIGYQAIWVGDIAVAAENFSPDYTTLTNGPAWLDRRGEVLYHGPHAGLELTW